jgi:hypothetical protein
MKAFKSHLLILLVAVLLTACDSGGSGGGSGEQIKNGVKDGISGLVSDINKEVVTDIRKSFPLPDQYSTLNHHNDVLNFTTPMSGEDVVSFYRREYAKQGFTEIAENSKVSADSATTVFKNASGGKTVYLQVDKTDSGSKVRVEKK